jgi:hypothetical protein
MSTSTATAAPPSRAQVQAQAQTDIEKQQREAQAQAERGFDKEAVAAIEETRKAIKALCDDKAADAAAAIERATGKIDVLTARHPQTALLAVAAEVEVIDTAPVDMDAIRGLATGVEAAVMNNDLPLARVLLERLISEVRVRTFHLPLATYPAALREAARLLDEKKNDEARAILDVALNTLVVIDRITPLPLILARVAINTAESLAEQDREAATRLLQLARNEVDRAVELGYGGKDDEYKTLSRTISDLEKQLKGRDNASSAFTKLKEKVTALFKRSENEKPPQNQKSA